MHLDFDGYSTVFWGGYSNASVPAYDLDGNPGNHTQAELDAIFEIWSRVAEDYAPFNIDVTTIDPISLADQRVAKIAIGGNGAWHASPGGGVAQVGGFYNFQSNVGWVFEDNLGNGQPKSVAEAVSHEAGHLFGLSHQSRWNGSTLVEEYHSGMNGWAPIMGIGYNQERTTWHDGPTSASSTSFQLDLSILSNANNGFGYRTDDVGGSTASASPLTVIGSSVVGAGIIERNDDQDWWSFSTTGGQVSFNLAVAPFGPNLDAVLELRNASGSVLVTADPQATLGASLSTTVGAGTYYVVARNNGGYGNLGQYTITGTIPTIADTTPPTADVVDILPDPRHMSVGSVALAFSENVTGLDITDLTLFRDGNPLTLTAAMLSGSGNSYALDLFSVTTVAGSYVLTLRASGSGIMDTAGNLLVADASDSWVIDMTGPTAGFLHVTPDPRNSAVGNVTLTFSEAVTGLDITDLALLRNGSPVTLTAAMLSGSGSSYTLDLSSVTTVAGNYVLTLTASGSGIADIAGNPLGAGASDSWTIDLTVPTADIFDISPDPRNSAVGNVALAFSESVSGLDIGDLTLTRDGSVVTLTAGMLGGSGSSYSLDLSSATTVAGSYVLTLRAAGSGIVDAAGNLLAAEASDSWTIDLTAPMADIIDITPDPRNSAVGSVTLTFSEAVTGLDISDLALLRNGSPVTLTAAMLSGSGSSYTLDLSSVTTVAGNYVLTLTASGSGIADIAGNPLGAGASDSWIIDLTGPTADIVDVAPDPRNSAVGNVTLSFSESVTGLDISDLTLLLNGSPVTLTAAMLGGSGSSYTLNLASVTSAAGSYVLTLKASDSGIADAAGNLLAADASDSWVIDLTGPTADIVDVTPDPRNSAVGNVMLTFSENVTGLDISDLALTRDGNPVTLTAGMLSGSGSSYTLNLASVTTVAGSYDLTLKASGSGIMDTAGNLLAAEATDAWTIDLTGPTADIVDVTPDPRNDSVEIVTLEFSESVSGLDISDLVLTHNGNLVALTPAMLTGNGASYALDLSTVTSIAGSYVLTLKASGSEIADAAGNLLAADASDAWDVHPPPPDYDVTRDGAVNVLDILAIVNWMTLHGVQPTTPDSAACDITGDGIINSLDILAIVNYMTELLRTDEVEGEGNFAQADAPEMHGPSSDLLLQILAVDAAAARRRREL